MALDSFFSFAKSSISWSRPFFLTLFVVGGARYLRTLFAAYRLSRRRAAEQRKLRIFRKELPELNSAVEKASRLPLKDAALSLWHRKSKLNCEEAPPKSGGQSTNIADPESFRIVINKAIAQVVFERDNAHKGSTFWRLKMAHPEASDQDLEMAIKAAVKFEKDCNKYYSQLRGEKIWDPDKAVDMARQENPDYLESTYKEQKHEMRLAYIF